MVLLQDGVADRGVKGIRPVKAVLFVPVDAAQVVDDVAAGEDQHPLAAQGRKSPADSVMLGGLQAAVDAQLHDGDVGLRKDPAQDRPGAVVNAPGVVRMML